MVNRTVMLYKEHGVRLRYLRQGEVESPVPQIVGLYDADGDGCTGCFPMAEPAHVPRPGGNGSLHGRIHDKTTAETTMTC